MSNTTSHALTPVLDLMKSGGRPGPVFIADTTNAFVSEVVKLQDTGTYGIVISEPPTEPNGQTITCKGLVIYTQQAAAWALAQRQCDYVVCDVATYNTLLNQHDKWWRRVGHLPPVAGKCDIIMEYVSKDEEKYMSTLMKIIHRGHVVMDRTGVGCRQLIGKSLSYDIRDYRLPLFTHRKMFYRGIVEELLFFISGNTDTSVLEKKGVNIWTKHTSKEWLESKNLPYPAGCYGPAYGFQLRHWGAEYDAHVDHQIGDDEMVHCGVDQLKYVIDLLTLTPNSRRILFSYWNPSVLDKVALPSCHLLYQFHVEDGFLSCTFYQRSNDFALAGNFNVVSASLLTMMLCKVCGLKPKKVVHHIGNAHVYENQVEHIQKYIDNKPRFAPWIDLPVKPIDEYVLEDFHLHGYYPHKKYTIPMTA